MSAPEQAEPSELTEADVVRRAQHGDAVAFERIYRSHSRKVYALCLRMTGDPSEAADLTQDVFLQLFRKIGTFRGESSFSTWLHRMAVNIVLMRFRKKPIADASLDALTDPEDEFSTAPKEFGSPDLRLNGVIDRVILQAAINELPLGYKAMFILHYVQGYKYTEIAEILGCTVGNSKSQVHKARMRLRELLQRSLRGAPHRRRKAVYGSLVMDRLKYIFDDATA
ncbi:MAG TPA: sigma-70 family RNA polymerase sigma factor [Terriglobales bacterium]|nr:sigma-70 family RNA polymerase sigma factor [Terriglobales bacterium]